RKLEASNDLYQTFIAHSIDTPEKFEAKRAELAEREWARMKENILQAGSNNGLLHDHYCFHRNSAGFHLAMQMRLSAPSPVTFHSC
ncbi:NapC/NirT family cytochrome c, partial [Salmonella enterica subsp. enterica serovar Kentucky]|nr:NapC/NirT family cytochrome c [Salmonella enterica subsp. enterica serovar Kentucky]